MPASTSNSSRLCLLKGDRLQSDDCVEKLGVASAGYVPGVIDPLIARYPCLLRDSEKSTFNFGRASGEQSSFSTESD